MTGLPVLCGSRVRLRGLRRADTRAVLRVFADPETSRFLEADLSDPVRAREMVRRRLDHQGPEGTGHWVIEFDGTVVGLAHLRPSSELPTEGAEIGWFLDRAHGGRGLATEATALLLEHGLGTLGLPAVWALVHEDNLASRKLAERLGFQDVGGGRHYGGPHRVYVVSARPATGVHHIELWVPDLERARASFGWLLGALSWWEYQRWSAGTSWRSGGCYLVVEQSPALSAEIHDRCRPGLNHLALHVPSQRRLDELVAQAAGHGWRPLFAERYPHAGGPDHYAAYLENQDGYEVELVATGN
ncbi:GNAT family N-acetyltransferase [Amycolatopsis aidingensis]|uniref:GNAT family N-acetyltransferase n=1 Tax=Amycolatopsis aidingensis TaxID=2842453 RepID=UPI001C0AB044|nr:GNAT family N-acetyltransferase [Amycolatopsis aidingensis]